MSESLDCIRWNDTEAELWFCRLTFHTAAACLQNIGVHFHPGLRQKLVPCQVGVVRGGNEVIIQGLRHVLGHLHVLRIEDVTCRTPQEVCKTCRRRQTSCVLMRVSLIWRPGCCFWVFQCSTHHQCPSPYAAGSQGMAQTWSQCQPDVLLSSLAPANEAAAKFDYRLVTIVIWFTFCLGLDFTGCMHSPQSFPMHSYTDLTASNSSNWMKVMMPLRDHGVHFEIVYKSKINSFLYHWSQRSFTTHCIYGLGDDKLNRFSEESTFPADLCVSHIWK